MSEPAKDLDGLRLQLEQELFSESLRDFLQAAWPILDPAPFVGGWHIDALCEHLEACSRGELTRLIINVPPGSSKTMTALIMWPAWEWTWRPQAKFMCATYEQPLSFIKAHVCQRLLESRWYQDRWGAMWTPDPKEWSVTMLANSKGGFRYATSKGSGATGLHADRQIVDDPHKPSDVVSGKVTQTDLRADLEKTWDWWSQTMATRLIAAPGTKSVRVVIMQRLHEGDLTGRLLREQAGEYEHLMIPQRFEPARRCFTVLSRDEEGTPVKTWEDPREEADELMCPDRMDEAFCDNRKTELGSRGYAAQEQQRPAPAGGGIFKRPWLSNFYRVRPAELINALWIQSWDMTYKNLASSDYVAGQVWAALAADYYLVDQIRAKLSFSESCNAMRSLTAKWPRAVTKLVENAANGAAIEDHLKHEIPGIILVTPKGGHVARANAVEPLWEAGNVHLPDPAQAPWVHDFIEEHISFPSGVYDDQVDAGTQALSYLHTKSTATYKQAMQNVGRIW